MWAHQNARSSESESWLRDTTTDILRAKLNRVSLAQDPAAFHKIVPHRNKRSPPGRPDKMRFWQRTVPKLGSTPSCGSFPSNASGPSYIPSSDAIRLDKRVDERQDNDQRSRAELGGGDHMHLAIIR